MISVLLSAVATSASAQTVYTWTAGSLDHEELQELDSSEDILTHGRNSYDVRSILHALVCQDVRPCPFTREDFLNALIDYGCNCYPESAKKQSVVNPRQDWYHMASLGRPVDQVDSECYNMHAAYQCMFKDHDAGRINQIGDLGCYPGMTFEYHITQNDDGSDEVICGTPKNIDYHKRDDDCRLASCQIERKFALAVLPYLSDPVSFRTTQHAQGKYSSNCARLANGPAGGVAAEKDNCCGDYPKRKPYNSISNSCCNIGGEFLLKPIGFCAEDN